MTTAPEEWRPVVGYEELYSVSSLGRVRRERDYRSTFKGRILKATPTPKGYLTIRLPDRNKRIHQIVAEAFLGPRPEGYEPNHKDGIKANNTLANLEWITSSENKRHAIRLGLAHPIPPDHNGEANGRAKLTVENVRTIRRSAAEGLFLAKQFGVSPSVISAVRTRRSWKHIP